MGSTAATAARVLVVVDEPDAVELLATSLRFVGVLLPRRVR